MKTFKFDENSKTDYWVKKIIPVLVRWAQSSWDKPHYYSDLSNAIGYNSNHVGSFLGRVNDIMKSLDKKIPTLNTLVISKEDGLPSHGLDYVYKDYNNLTDDEKKVFVRHANQKAHEYDWNTVLSQLGLEPALILTSEEVEDKRKKMNFPGGGESKYHLKLKEYRHNHPETIEIYNVINSETAHILFSGDKVDVYFETEDQILAVEVKSRISDENDIIRGIFQTIKYKAVLEAERLFGNSPKDVYSILVTENEISKTARQISDDLNIEVFDNYKIKI